MNWKQRNPVPFVSVGISTSASSCVHRSPDTQLCTLVIPDLASSASRVVLFVSLDQDFSSCSSTGARDFVVGSTACAVPPPWAPHVQDQNCQLSSHLDDGCFPLQPMMFVPTRPRVTDKIRRCTDAFAAAHLQWSARACKNNDHFCRSTACIDTVSASPAAASGGRPATGVPPHDPTENDSSRSDDGKRRTVRATTMPTLVPMK